jgi:RecB family endonuclease NucS
LSNRKPVTVYENPTVHEAADIVKQAVSERKTAILVGNCWVDYKGRASSKLEAGERIIMIKEDGSVLVHRPFGYEPVNWQPSGCMFQTRIKDDVLQVRAFRKKPLESVKFSFDAIHVLTVMKLVDRGEFSLHASESDMQKAILIDPTLVEDGFKPISYEKKVEPGFVDVYGVDKNGKLLVVELKRVTAGKNAALQLAKYIEYVKTVSNRELRGMLVAPRLAKGVQTILTSMGLEFKALEPKTCADVLRRSETRKLADFFEA